MYEILKPYLEENIKSKKGVIFHVNGSTVIGYVTKILSPHLLEVKSQRTDKILILIDKIDAMEIS